MKRLLAAMKVDALLQARNQLYAISFVASVIFGGALAWLSPAAHDARAFPMAILFIVGGSTMLYVVAMIILEKDDGTLDALVVSPLRPGEYLASKVLTLTLLACIEGVLMTYGALAWIARSEPAPWPNGLFFVGMIALGVMHVLAGVIVAARYDRIMEAILPMGFVATVMQLPAFWYVGVISSRWVLLIPSGAPAMFLRGAFVPLSPWEWAYAVGGTALVIGGLARWSLVAFRVHIIGLPASTGAVEERAR